METSSQLSIQRSPNFLKARATAPAAFVGSFVLDHRFGLNQGFDTFDDAMPIGMLESQEAERNADAVYAAFSKWLPSVNNQSPFFVWIHLYDPHAPYNPPEPFRTQYSNDLYAGEIAYTDHVIGKIFRDLKAKQFNNNIIAIAGDHGEGLGEHQEQTHSLLIYNSTLHIPMILVAPGVIPPDSNFPGLSRLIDLGPTLLEYAQIKTTLAGSGVSLKSALEKTKDLSLYSFSESFYPKINLGWSELHGIETEKHHYIDAPKPELYDLINDSAETQNQIHRFPDIGRKLKAEIDRLYKTQKGQISSSNEEMDPETKERLASLGYVSGSGSSSKSSSGIDPKDKIQVWNEIQKGIYQFGSQNYKDAINTFESVLKTEKYTRIVYDHLCSAHIKLEQYDRAKSCIQNAISNRVDFASLHVNLGQINHMEKRYDLAEKEFRIALAMDDQNVLAHYSFANLMRATGKHEQALTEYQKALQINPRYVFAMNGLAMTYSALRRDEDAIKFFRQAVNNDPENPSPYFNLAVQAEKMKKTEEALHAYQKFLELSSEKNFPEQRQRANEAIRRLSSTP